MDPHPCPARVPLTKARSEEELPDTVSHRGCKGEADEGLDVQLVHQAQPRVLLGLQRVRGQHVWVGSKNSISGSGTPQLGLTLVSSQHPHCKTNANPCAHPSTHKTERVEAGASSQRDEIIHKYIKNTTAAPSPLPNFRPLVTTATAGGEGAEPMHPLGWGWRRPRHVPGNTCVQTNTHQGANTPEAHGHTVADMK